MFARVNASEAINVTQHVSFIKVQNLTAEGVKRYCADFHNGQGKVMARSYDFKTESDCWDFVRRVVTDTARRDLLEIPKLDLLDKSQSMV